MAVEECLRKRFVQFAAIDMRREIELTGICGGNQLMGNSKGFGWEKKVKKLELVRPVLINWIGRQLCASKFAVYSNPIFVFISQTVPMNYPLNISLPIHQCRRDIFTHR
jgi:hypothetical protein